MKWIICTSPVRKVISIESSIVCKVNRILYWPVLYRKLFLHSFNYYIDCVVCIFFWYVPICIPKLNSLYIYSNYSWPIKLILILKFKLVTINHTFKGPELSFTFLWRTYFLMQVIHDRGAQGWPTSWFFNPCLSHSSQAHKLCTLPFASNLLRFGLFQARQGKASLFM